MAENFAIEMRGITKTFGSVIANKNINLTARPGEILALLGSTRWRGQGPQRYAPAAPPKPYRTVVSH